MERKDRDGGLRWHAGWWVGEKWMGEAWAGHPALT